MKRLTLAALALSFCLLVSCSVSVKIGKDEKSENGKEDDVISLPAPDITEDEMIAKFQKASEAYSWFTVCTCETGGETVEKDGEIYSEVGRFATMKDFREYLSTLFSKELTDRLISESSYTDIDGVLFVRSGARGTDIFVGEESYETIPDGENRYIVRVNYEKLDFDDGGEPKVIGYDTYDYPLEYIDGAWVFTDFFTVR